jgi:hypothetical protein
MNPEMQIILDMMNKHFNELQSSIENKFVELNHKWLTTFGDFEEAWSSKFVEHDDKWECRFSNLRVSHDAHMSTLERAAVSFEDWKSGIEGTIYDVRLELGKLSKHWERAARDRSPPLLPTTAPSSVVPPQPTSAKNL